MPGSPAVPKNRAYSDHRNADRVPIETRVSIVAVRCLRLAQAAVWKGRPAHTTTGVARASEAHCQERNCRAGIIAIAMTGLARTAAVTSRFRSDVSSGSPVGTVPAGSWGRRDRTAA